DVEVEVPPAVFKQLQELLAEHEREHAQISFEIDMPSTAQVKQLIELAENKYSATIDVVGNMYSFKLSVVKQDGTALQLEHFSEPIKITLSQDDDINAART